MLPKRTDTNICNSIQISTLFWTHCTYCEQYHIHIILDTLYLLRTISYPHYSGHTVPTANNIISYPQFLRNKNFNLFDKSSIFYICLFYVKFPENDRTQIETCWSLGEMCVKMYCNTFAFVVVQYTTFHSCTAVSTTETFHT